MVLTPPPQRVLRTTLLTPFLRAASSCSMRARQCPARASARSPHATRHFSCPCRCVRLNLVGAVVLAALLAHGLSFHPSGFATIFLRTCRAQLASPLPCPQPRACLSPGWVAVLRWMASNVHNSRRAAPKQQALAQFSISLLGRERAVLRVPCGSGLCPRVHALLTAPRIVVGVNERKVICRTRGGSCAGGRCGCDGHLLARAPLRDGTGDDSAA